jgi:hypothetical protein
VHTQLPPLPHGALNVLHAGAVMVGVEVVVVVVVVVVLVAQSDDVHASQQLGNAPTHAPPPFGATQRSALRLSVHDVLPDFRVRQHATKSGLPHVDLDSQCLTAPAQALLTSARLATSIAQRT